MRVLTVNGEPWRSTERNSHAPVKQAELVSGSGARIQARIMYGPMTRGPTKFSLWALGAVFTVFASVVVLRRADLQTARWFCAFGYFTAITLAVSPSAGGTQPMWSLILEFLGIVGIGATLLPFVSSLLGGEEQPVLPHVIWVHIGGGVLLAAGYALAVIAIPTLYSILRACLGLYLATSVVGAISLLAIKGSRQIPNFRRKQSRLVLLGILLGTMPFVALTLLPEVLGGSMLLPAHITVLPWALIPASSAIAIVHFHLLDIRRLIHRGMIYTGTTTILLIGIVVLATAATPLVQSASTRAEASVLVGGLVLLGVLAFHPVRAGTRWLVDRYLYREVADPQRLIDVIREDLTAANLRDDTTILIERIASTLQVESAMLFHGPSPTQTHLVARAGSRAEEILDRAYPELRDSVRFWRRRDTRELRWGAETLLLAPLWITGSYVGHLLLGPKEAGEVFVSEEKHLVATITPIVALALHQSELSDQLGVLNQRLVAAEEAERARLASDLHDGPLQKAILLGGAVDPALANPHLVARELIAELREVCSRLRPAILDDLGLVPALEWLLEDTARRFNVAPHLALQNIEEADRFRQDTELALFRITQEAINNAVKHGRPGAIDVSLIKEGVTLTLKVEDNGDGFVENSTMTVGLGIPGIRGRVFHLGGSIDIRSTLGVGTSVIVRVPY